MTYPLTKKFGTSNEKLFYFLEVSIHTKACQTINKQILFGFDITSAYIPNGLISAVAHKDRL